MSTVINTNLASLYAQNNLSNAQNNLAQSVMRLSSGLRINGAKDDAAGLAISQNMQGQINSVNQSVRNLNDATNLIQVADTSMSTIHDMLLRIKQLATQGYDGSLSNSQKVHIMDEIKQLNTEINNTATRTKFNGNSLIATGVGLESSSTLRVGVSSSSDDKTFVGNIALSGTNPLSNAGTSPARYTFTVSGAAVTLTSNGVGAPTETVTAASGTAGGSQVLNFATLGIAVTLNTGTNETSATTTVADLATKFLDVGGSATSSLDFQGGADTGVANIISYNTINIKTDGSTAAIDAMTTFGAQVTTMGNILNTNSTYDWQTAFNTLGSNVDAAINTVSDQRSIMGSLINRIAYISTNLQAQSTNLQSSKSAIIDTDFAAETAKLTKGQIMQQAATAMLAQANQMPNVVLSLLK